MGLRRFFLRRQAERDLDDEIRFDLAEESRRLIERGEPADSARAAARRGFGSITRIKEETRQAWGWAGAERLVQDLRFAFRRVRTSPGFSLAAVLTFTVGLGLCSFLFNTLDALLLRPAPGVREPAQLVATQAPVAFAYFESYRGLSDVAAATAAYSGPVPFNLALDNGDAAHAERVSGHLVSLEYFSTLGARPLLGRFFEPDLDRRGGPPTAVVSERFWRTRLNADSHVIGRAVWINRQQATIIGVAEKDFQGLFPIMPADIFVPVTVDPAVAPELAGNALEDPASRAFRVFLRLAPGVTINAAEAALDTRTRQLDDTYGYRQPNQESAPRRARLIRAGTVAPYPTELRSAVRHVLQRDDSADSHIHLRQHGWPRACARERAASRSVSSSCPGSRTRSTGPAAGGRKRAAGHRRRRRRSRRDVWLRCPADSRGGGVTALQTGGAADARSPRRRADLPRLRRGRGRARSDARPRRHAYRSDQRAEGTPGHLAGPLPSLRAAQSLHGLSDHRGHGPRRDHGIPGLGHSVWRKPGRRFYGRGTVGALAGSRS